MAGLIETYQQYDLQKKNLTAERTIQFIKGQLADISDSLKIFEGQLERFKLNTSVERLDGEATRLLEKLTPLEEQRTELINRDHSCKYISDYLVKYIKQGNNYDLIVLPSSVGVEGWRAHQPSRQ